MDNRQVAFALGLAQKAGKVAAGDFAVRSALNGGKAKLMRRKHPARNWNTLQSRPVLILLQGLRVRK